MAQRWLQQKLDTDKRRKDAKLGRHARFHGWTKLETKEKDERVGRALEMRTPSIATSEMVAEFVTRKVINRAPCNGVMPQGAYNNQLRKARKQPVKLWYGTDGRPNNAIAAPPGKGMLTNNWSRDTTWKIVKRG